MKNVSLTTALLLLLSTGTAGAGSVFVNDRIIKTVVPPGYCEVGYSTEERQLIAALQYPSGQLMNVFVNCRELAQLKASKRHQVHNYGFSWAAGGPALGISRAQYLEGFKSGDPQTNILAGKGLQILGTTQYGAFAGGTGRAKLDSGEVGNVAGVVGYTVIADHVYTINYYSRSASEPIVGIGYDTLAPLMETFVKANGN